MLHILGVLIIWSVLNFTISVGVQLLKHNAILIKNNFCVIIILSLPPSLGYGQAWVASWRVHLLRVPEESHAEWHRQAHSVSRPIHGRLVSAWWKLLFYIFNFFLKCKMLANLKQNLKKFDSNIYDNFSLIRYFLI